VKVRGYEIKCSPWTAELLGAWFGTYRGRGILHYGQGHLWWISVAPPPS
jgi:hypothetical protein